MDMNLLVAVLVLLVAINAWILLFYSFQGRFFPETSKGNPRQAAFTFRIFLVFFAGWSGSVIQLENYSILIGFFC